MKALLRFQPPLLLIIIGICRSDIHRIQPGNSARQLRVERRFGREEEVGLKDAFNRLGVVGLSLSDGNQFVEGTGELFIVVATLFE